MKRAYYLAILAGLFGVGSVVMVRANDQAQHQLQQQKKKTTQSILLQRRAREQRDEAFAAAEAAKKSTNNVVAPRDPKKPDLDWPYASPVPTPPAVPPVTDNKPQS